MRFTAHIMAAKKKFHMKQVPHLSGYTIKCALNLKELDPEWKVHPVH